MRSINGKQFRLILVFTFLTFFSNISVASHILSPSQSIKDGQTLVSEGNHFELGFFSPGNSKNRYLGIWYKNIPTQTVVWVANRHSPITNLSGVLVISEEGHLVLRNEELKVFWSTNQSKSEKPIAELLDSGNLVIREENSDSPENYLWQSFDYPTNTLLPGMKLGWDLKTGVNRFLTSWKNADDPSTGLYSFSVDRHGFPQVFLWNQQRQRYRSGPWNGIQFSGVPEMKPLDGFNFSFVVNQAEIYYKFTVNSESIVSRLIVNEAGVLQRLTWIDTTLEWTVFWYAPKDQCDYYRECGVYGVCDANNSPVCNCVQGFEPKYPKNWDLRDGSGGCVRKMKFECNKDDGFLHLKGMKLPDTSTTLVNKSTSLKECEEECRKNCSCTAYANSLITRNGKGCIVWFGDLIDLREYADGGQDLYVRVAASELEKSDSHKKKPENIIVTVAVISVILLLGLSFCFIWKEKIMKILGRSETDNRVNRVKSQELPFFDVIVSGTRDYSDEKKDDLELPLLDLDTIAGTTNNFSIENKLGQGGFGCVYKGTFADGQQIAVKRLSKNSGQGIEEFKNEVMLIAKLQHRNLVRLLGCCVEGEEKMLIYEYMQNKSLDSILFDNKRRQLLGWRKRFDIIVGIARGLLYLHQDSRFRIIHRDLKASNVLLDEEMKPKISDFGMARIFGGDQTEASTKRVVGTYGYMSPEYAMDGLFSVKSDVFSYGVLVLEIVSGIKNRGFYHSNSQLNLLGHAWKLWEEGKCLDLMDASMGDSWSTFEVLRCIHVGLLCVQEQAEDRPTMSTVVLMLSSETAGLPQPKEPGFALGRIPSETNSSFNKQESCTVNQVTVTMLDAR